MFYLSDPQPLAEKRAFMQQLSDSGNSTFCIVLASQLFEQRDPDVEAIKKILHTTADHGSDGPNYFLMMLNVMARGELPMDEVFPVFHDIFERRQMARCRRAIMNL